MKYLKHLIFTFMVVLGLSVVASAQKHDQKRPPKERPPVVTPSDKNPPKENPPKNNGDGKGNRGRGNRPGLAAIIPGNQITLEVF
jgi:hypothetical protein